MDLTAGTKSPAKLLESREGQVKLLACAGAYRGGSEKSRDIVDGHVAGTSRTLCGWDEVLLRWM